MPQSLLGELSVADLTSGVAVASLVLGLVLQDVWRYLFGPRARPAPRVRFSSSLDL